MVLGGVMRSVAGWKADKYQFEVTIHSAYNLLPGTKALQVQWKRGTKSTATKPVKAQRGEALWHEELSLVCTMFVNPKTSTHEPKPAVFVVREILDAPLKERDTCREESLFSADRQGLSWPHTLVAVASGGDAERGAKGGGDGGGGGAITAGATGAKRPAVVLLALSRAAVLHSPD